jgi:uncharacterized protein (TIGR03435 family)
VSRALVLFAGVCVAAFAQTPAMRFETASIRPSQGPRAEDEANPSFRAYRKGKAPSFCMVCISGTHYDNYGTALKVLIANSYGIDPRLVTGPAWLDDQDTSFVIHATMREGSTRPQVQQMVKALLEERFHLEAHTATVEQVGYALVVAKNGPKLKPAREMDRSECAQWTESIPTDGKPNLMCRIPAAEGGFAGTILMTNSHFGPTRNSSSRTEAGVEWHAEYFRITMALLTERLGIALSTVSAGMAGAGSVVRVVDHTGIAGEWDVVIDRESGDLALPSVNGSLERQGLRLEKMMAPVETLVVDRVDRVPTAN